MSLPSVVALEGVPRRYAWGSRTAIPRLLGQAPDGRPTAELWFGAHPDDPARLAGTDTALDAVIAADPEAALGPAVLARFGPQLPFLVKLLAAATPLSIQVHPDLAQARAGFAAENAAGVALDSPERNYRDPNHKPELLCALSEFQALCGFRPVADTLRLLRDLAVPGLDPIAALLAGPDGLRAAFVALLAEPEPAPLVAAVAAAARRIGPDSEWAGPASAVAHTVEEYPRDVGVVLSLLLNHVTLRPGEAIYLGAGNVHAYIRGLGVEIMANSDNVLRCGLTPKHVDVAELTRIAEFAELPDPRCPTAAEPGGLGFASAASDFHLGVVPPGPDGAPLDRPGPAIVVGGSGRTRVEVGGSGLELGPGQAAFVAAARDAGRVSVAEGRAFVATVGELDR